MTPWTLQMHHLHHMTRVPADDIVLSIILHLVCNNKVHLNYFPNPDLTKIEQIPHRTKRQVFIEHAVMATAGSLGRP